MPIARVQSKTGTLPNPTPGDTGPYTASLSFTSTPANNNMLVAVIGTNGTSTSRVTSITQTGATWTKIKEVANANGVTSEIWVAYNISGAGTSVTFSIPAGGFLPAAVIAEYSGLPAASGLSDKTASATGNSDAPSSGATATTTRANELWIAGIVAASTTDPPTVGASFTRVGSVSTTAVTIAMEEQIVSATGSASVTDNTNLFHQYAGVIGTFLGFITTTKTQTGKGNIRATTTKTQTGKGSVQKTTTQTVTGTGRINLQQTKTVTAASRVRKTVAPDQAGTGRIKKTVDQAITGVGAVRKTVGRDQSGTGRINTTTRADQTATGRVKKTVDQIISGTGRVRTTTARDHDGTGRVRKTVAANQPGISSVSLSTTRTQAGAATVKRGTEAGQTGMANIRTQMNADLSGTSSVIRSGTGSVTGRARMSLTSAKDQTARGRVTVRAAKDQSSKGAISKATYRDQAGRSSVSQNALKLQGGRSSILVPAASLPAARGGVVQEKIKSRSIKEIPVARAVVEEVTLRCTADLPTLRTIEGSSVKRIIK